MNRRRDNQPSPASERPFRVLAFRDFRLLWTAEFLSQIGTQVQRVAVAWQVFEMTRDPFQLGLLGLARFIPLLVFGLVGGVIADRYERRRTLMLAQTALMTMSGMFAALTITGQITLLWIYALTAISTLFGAIANPTRQALIPTLVPTAVMPAAMTMGVLAFQTAGMVGPAFGGLLIAAAGVPFAYALDAATFGLVGMVVVLLHARPARPARVVSGIAALGEGLAFLRAMPILLGTMALDFLANFFGAGTSLMPIFAAEILGGGPSTLGLLLAAPAVGAVLAATFLASRSWLPRPGFGILAAIAVYGFCIIGFALSTNLLLSLAFLFASGAADSLSVTLRHTLRNLLTPDQLRGRVSAAHSTFAAGGPQLGEFEAGVVASLTGAPAAVALGGLGTLLSVAIIANRVPAIARLRWPVSGVEKDASETELAGSRRAVDIDETGTGSI
ncbi:MAG: MFS transporter [Thermomicrobiales bacterium]